MTQINKRAETKFKKKKKNGRKKKTKLTFINQYSML